MTPDRILRKIERCLALSRSANEHEAGTALRQAQRLMAEYGISEIDVAASTIDRVAIKTPAGREPPRWLNCLVQLVNSAFGTAAVYEPRRTVGGWQGDFAFLGEASQVRIAAYAFEVLQRQLISDRKAFLNGMHKRAKRVTKVRRADAYASAWVAGAYEHIVPVQKTEEAIAAIEHFQQRLYPELESLKAIDRGHRRDDHRAMAKGYAAGRHARLHSGVDRDKHKELTHG
ncbi:DUF2786 domain-containing protein [Salinicola endophyticus]|uniref:DUF2786 domain-containing protein n=1 Tax=Salinicola endophyticus TaxID=1949083 RepID=A0AB74U866_9GAMM